MISLTPRAARELRMILTRVHARPDEALRLALDGRGGISRIVSTASGSDLRFADEAGPVLLIGAELAQRVDGLVFDSIRHEDHQGVLQVGLSFRRPTAEERPQALPPPPEAGAAAGAAAHP